jgi:HlyD family secretion protein
MAQLQLPGPSKKPKRQWRASKHMSIGFIALAVLVAGLGGWAVMANIAGAIVSSGSIEVEANRQVVQHPEGGVVGEINVVDGDLVEAGTVLIRFDDTLLRSELAVIEGQLFEIIARKARLRAERDGADEITFTGELEELARGSDIDIEELKEGQQRLFEARRKSLAQEAEQLGERKIQIGQQIEGTQAQLSSLTRQLELLTEELADQQELLDKGLAQASRVLALQRDEARLFGQVGELQAGVAEARGRIAEIEIELLKLQSSLREEAITTLRDLQYNEIELKERRLTSLETLSRLEVRAPLSGIVYGKVVHALRSVVRAAEPMMYIVPQDSPLVISSRIETIHIDEVQVGQEAKLVFSTFDARTTPELNGKVTRVSADVITDEVTGMPYYEAEILPDEGELAKLEGKELLPGMPVESFIKTRDRTPLSYLVKPLADYFNRAFRES